MRAAASLDAMRLALRYAWAAPNTLIGLGLALVGLWRGRLTIVQGVLEAHGPGLRWMLHHLTPLASGAAAITLGHVVLGADAQALEATRRHERVHVRQYEQWGPFFIPAYVAAGLWMMACGHHPYLQNPFERHARTASLAPLRSPSMVRTPGRNTCAILAADPSPPRRPSRSHTPGMFPPRALRAGRLDAQRWHLFGPWALSSRRVRTGAGGD